MAAPSLPRASLAEASPRAPALTFAEPVTERGAWAKIKEEPVAFGFLALTVGALGLGLRSLHNNDKRQSQLMMRARVFFQFCAVSALLGNIYYRAAQHEGAAPARRAARARARARARHHRPPTPPRMQQKCASPRPARPRRLLQTTRASPTSRPSLPPAVRRRRRRR